MLWRYVIATTFCIGGDFTEMDQVRLKEIYRPDIEQELEALRAVEHPLNGTARSVPPSYGTAIHRRSGP
jgi:hypothetical protein